MWKDILTLEGRWGRLNRKRYFLYRIIANLPIVAVLIVFAITNTLAEAGIVEKLSPLVRIINFSLTLLGFASVLFALIPFPLEIKRLHDLGKSGWWMLLTFIPFVNLFYHIYILFWKGQSGKNKFGVDPLEQV